MPRNDLTVNIFIVEFILTRISLVRIFPGMKAENRHKVLQI